MTTPAPPAAPADRSTLAGLRAAWITAVAARDAEALRPLLADDYELWANAAGPLRGVDAAVAAMRAALERYRIVQSFEVAESVIAGDWAFERGLERMTITLATGGPAQTMTQRTLLILRRGPDRQWQFARGMTNGLPPERPSPPDSGESHREGGATELTYHEGFETEEFLTLAQRVWPREYSSSDASAALARTINIGAWDGARLVGSVRVLTDGYFFATIPEILVDPAYQRRGIGRRLMELALERAPRGKIAFGAQPESIAFFERIGCRRALAGFVAERPLPAAVLLNHGER